MHCSADFSKSLGVGRYRSYPRSRYYCMILLGFYPGSRTSFVLDVSFIPRLRSQDCQPLQNFSFRRYLDDYWPPRTADRVRRSKLPHLLLERPPFTQRSQRPLYFLLTTARGDDATWICLSNSSWRLICGYKADMSTVSQTMWINWSGIDKELVYPLISAVSR